MKGVCFRVESLGFMVYGVEFRVQGLGVMVKVRVQGSGSRVLPSSARGSAWAQRPWSRAGSRAAQGGTPPWARPPSRSTFRAAGGSAS